jgi:hypothetical protein
MTLPNGRACVFPIDVFTDSVAGIIDPPSTLETEVTIQDVIGNLPRLDDAFDTKVCFTEFDLHKASGS